MKVKKINTALANFFKNFNGGLSKPSIEEIRVEIRNYIDDRKAGATVALLESIKSAGSTPKKVGEIYAEQVLEKELAEKKLNKHEYEKKFTKLSKEFCELITTADMAWRSFSRN